MLGPLAAPTAPRRLLGLAVLPTTDGTPLRPRRAAIDVIGSTIAAVHPLDAGAEPPPAPPDAIVEDFGDRMVTPAFIDGHTHLALTSLRGLAVPEHADANLVEDFFFKIETRTTAEDVRAFVRMGAYEALLHGTALVWDHYYHTDAVLAGLLDVGLPAVIAPTLQDLGGPGVDQREIALERTAAIAADPALAARGIFAAYGPHATDTVSDALFTRVAELAERHALPVHCHVAQSLDELERVRELRGCSPLDVLRRTGVLDAAPRSLLIHNIFVTEADVAALDADRVALGFCPHSKEIFAYLPDIRAWQAARLPWFIGTDCAASNDAINIQRELRATAGLRTVGVTWSPAHQAFLDSGSLDDARDAWRERARDRAKTPWLADPRALLDRVWGIPGSLHPAFRAGVIAPGALANLSVWDLDHPTFWPAREPVRALTMSDTTGALHNVMAAGRWIGTHGDYARSVVATDAYREAHREASERLAALERRL
ncbi:MAG: hypothetical protein EP329_20765 [Deltaproteobacteria bacterium]|nr:MAG: hypothetical protein EP329_20765 [Deltaproteobacteria bacterium]